MRTIGQRSAYSVRDARQGRNGLSMAKEPPSKQIYDPDEIENQKILETLKRRQNRKPKQ